MFEQKSLASRRDLFMLCVCIILVLRKLKSWCSVTGNILGVILTSIKIGLLSALMITLMWPHRRCIYSYTSIVLKIEGMKHARAHVCVYACARYILTYIVYFIRIVRYVYQRYLICVVSAHISIYVAHSNGFPCTFNF